MTIARAQSISTRWRSTSERAEGEERTERGETGRGGGRERGGERGRGGGRETGGGRRDGVNRFALSRSGERREIEGYPLDDPEVAEKEISPSGVQVSLAIGRQRARKGPARRNVTAGQSHRVVSPEGGCEEGSHVKGGVWTSLFDVRTDGQAAGGREGGEGGEMEMSPSGPTERRVSEFLSSTMTTSSPLIPTVSRHGK